ncbi:hypothetical protein EVAR_43895_1 [Eumeta japonica]|uniref:Uncharacterized protein n=1 Tax=Eumeta variegata TaxID=151549 RepID=A0A4C1WRF9_EUMVA|nr:hypothetical protein EVAR_43895_1 [Eumeta japonica]
MRQEGRSSCRPALSRRSLRFHSESRRTDRSVLLEVRASHVQPSSNCLFSANGPSTYVDDSMASRPSRSADRGTEFISTSVPSRSRTELRLSDGKKIGSRGDDFEPPARHAPARGGLNDLAARRCELRRLWDGISPAVGRFEPDSTYIRVVT